MSQTDMTYQYSLLLDLLTLEQIRDILDACSEALDHEGDRKRIFGYSELLQSLTDLHDSLEDAGNL